MILLKYFFFFQFIFAFEAKSKCLKINFIDEFHPSRSHVVPRFSQDISRGIDIAQNLLLEKQGKCININKVDTGSSLANIPYLIKKNRSFSPYFIGLGSSNKALASVDTLTETKSILLSTTATNDTLNTNLRLLMVSTTNSSMSKELAAKLYKKGIKKISCIYAINDTYSTDYFLRFKKHFQDLGGTLNEIKIRSSNIKESDFISNIKNDQFLLIPLYELDVAKIIRIISSHKLSPTYISTDSWSKNSPIIKTLTQELKNIKIISSTIYAHTLSNSENQFFVQTFKKKYGEFPPDSSAFAYESIKLLSLITEKCSEQQILDNIVKCMNQILPYNSVTGLITSMNGNSLRRSLHIEGLD